MGVIDKTQQGFVRCGMYNEERKVRFMSECGMEGSKGVWAVATFNNTQLMEEELGKDLAELTAEEVGDALATTGVVSSATIGNRIPLVVRYKKWCAEKGFQTVLVVSEDIRVDVTDNIRDTMVSSPSQLAYLLQKAFPDNVEKSARCVYRAYLWMGFAGMNMEDAADVRVSDVDLNSRMIKYNNRWYVIPEEGIDDIRRVCKAKEFYRLNRGSKTAFQRADGDRILRGRKLKKEITVHGYVRETLRPVIQNGFKAIGYNGMSFLRIRKSGLFYEMFRREVHGFAISFATIAHDDYLAGNYKESKANPKQKVVRRIMLTYEKDYAAWKNAFAEELMEEFRITEMPSDND